MHHKLASPLRDARRGAQQHGIQQLSVDKRLYLSNFRLPALPVQSSGSSPSKQQQLQQQQVSAREPLRLVEIQDRRKTTYSWQNSSSGVIQHQQDQHVQPVPGQHDQGQQTMLEHQQQQLLPASLPGKQEIIDAVKTLYLPAGYPSSVTDDYLAYQLCTVPAHITGWLSISLATSSLLKAVGINAGPVGATAAAAAIKWIVKDGIGAAGRLLVGGRLGLEFDDDPRRWRMAAEALTTAGLAMEIATAIYPSQFLLLASLGNFSKAVGKGMGKPVFRVIQTHFAAAGNVGAVAAKEEVWEVSAQLTGYAASVLLLQALQDAGSWQTVVGLWAMVQGTHVAARFLALKQLRFRYLNQKRASLLLYAHVRGEPLPGIKEANQQEPMLLPASAMQPCVTFGCSMQQAWGVEPSQLQPDQLAGWLEVFKQQGYMLVWRDRQAYVVLKEQQDAGQQQSQQQLQQVLLKSMWQAAWLEAHDKDAQQQLQGTDVQQQGLSLGLLRASMEAADQSFGHFLEEARGLGWNTDMLVFKVGRARVQVL